MTDINDYYKTIEIADIVLDDSVFDWKKQWEQTVWEVLKEIELIDKPS